MTHWYHVFAMSPVTKTWLFIGTFDLQPEAVAAALVYLTHGYVIRIEPFTTEFV